MRNRYSDDLLHILIPDNVKSYSIKDKDGNVLASGSSGDQPVEETLDYEGWVYIELEV